MKQHNGLCISGGSFKGISALGALFYMEEKEQLKNIKYYAGTSIGGIIITLLCCGIKPFEIFSYIYTEKNLLNIFLGVNNLIDYFSTNMEDIIKGIGLYKIYDTFSYKIEEFILQKTGWEKIPTLKELFDFQKQAVSFVDEVGGRSLIADDMGLGKTIEAIGYAVYKRYKNVLVICPASVKYNWQNEIKTLLNDSYISWKADLYNIRGELVLNKVVERDVLIFDISSLPSGIYFEVL